MGAKGRNFYNDLAVRYGYGEAAATVQDLYLAGRKEEAAAALPEDLVRAVSLVGPESWVAERIAAFAEVASVSAISGRNNLMAIVICRDVEHLHSFLTGELGALKHIRSYEISIRTQRLKQAGSLVAGGRLVRTPR